MIDKLSESFAFRQSVLALRQRRHEVLAANIANADTPHYKARDFDFSAELARATSASRKQGAVQLSRTSERHIAPPRGVGLVENLQYRIPDQPSLDGNTVSMDRERAHFTDNSVRQQASLTFMSSHVQGLRQAMQPE